MSKVITYYKKFAYGKHHMYLSKPEDAGVIYSLTKPRCFALTPKAKYCLEQLGFSFQEVPTPSTKERKELDTATNEAIVAMEAALKARAEDN